MATDFNRDEIAECIKSMADNYKRLHSLLEAAPDRVGDAIVECNLDAFPLELSEHAEALEQVHAFVKSDLFDEALSS
jgi:hypothetical protein